MRILLIAPICPLPLESGGAVRIWNIAKQLSKSHVVDLVCFTRQEGERRYEDSLREVFHSVKFIQRRGLFDRSALSQGVLAAVKFFLSNSSVLIAALFSARPLLSKLYDSEEMQKYLMEMDAEGSYDLFYAETFYGIASLKGRLDALRTKLLLMEENIESSAYQRQAERQKNPLLRRLMLHDVRKIHDEERWFWQNSSLIAGLSPVDVKEIRDSTGREPMTLENGVDIGSFSQPVCDRVSNEVLFVGSFTYFQNIDSLRWLLEEIWPLVRASLPDAQLRIVGRGADAAFNRYVLGKGFRIDEGVDDIREAFQHASVLIAPIRAGSGTKYKVLEAMASHLPVITTSVGAEGLDIVPGRDAIVADDPAELALKVVALFNRPDDRARIADQAYRFVSEQYDWQQIVARFEVALQKELGAG